jgi:hypothetical protein
MPVYEVQFLGGQSMTIRHPAPSIEAILATFQTNGHIIAEVLSSESERVAIAFRSIATIRELKDRKDSLSPRPDPGGQTDPLAKFR